MVLAVEPVVLTREVLGLVVPLVGQLQVLQHALHLPLRLLLGAALQQGVEQDVLLHGEAAQQGTGFRG